MSGRLAPRSANTGDAAGHARPVIRGKSTAVTAVIADAVTNEKR